MSPGGHRMAVDVWALGVTLFNWLTGKLPYWSDPAVTPTTSDGRRRGWGEQSTCARLCCRSEMAAVSCLPPQVGRRFGARLVQPDRRFAVGAAGRAGAVRSAMQNISDSRLAAARPLPLPPPFLCCCSCGCGGSSCGGCNGCGCQWLTALFAADGVASILEMILEKNPLARVTVAGCQLHSDLRPVASGSIHQTAASLLRPLLDRRPPAAPLDDERRGRAGAVPPPAASHRRIETSVPCVRSVLNSAMWAVQGGGAVKSRCVRPDRRGIGGRSDAALPPLAQSADGWGTPVEGLHRARAGRAGRAQQAPASTAGQVRSELGRLLVSGGVQSAVARGCSRWRRAGPP